MRNKIKNTGKRNEENKNQISNIKRSQNFSFGCRKKNCSSCLTLCYNDELQYSSFINKKSRIERI